MTTDKFKDYVYFSFGIIHLTLALAFVVLRDPIFACVFAIYFVINLMILIAREK